MPQIFSPNLDPRYYAQPNAYRATIGAAAITAFPTSATVGGVQASGSFTFTANPANGATISVNGVTVTFSTASGFSLANQLSNGTVLSANGVPLPFQAIGQAGLQVLVGATLGQTLANLLGVLRAWPDENLQACNYRLTGGALRVFSNTTGTAGNSVALAATAGANVTITGAATVNSGAAGNTTLTGGTAPTSGYAVLVEPQPHPVELSGVNAICRASQTQGTLTLFKSDGTTLSKIPQGTITFAAGNTLGAAQELAAIPFPLITPAATLVVQPWTGLYAYGSTTQVIDIEAAPAGAY